MLRDPGFRRLPRPRPGRGAAVLLPLLAVSSALLFFGCDNDPGSPHYDPRSTWTSEEPQQSAIQLEGADLPSGVEEGEPFSFIVWGTTPDRFWVAEGCDLRFLPGGDGRPERIEVTARGRRTTGHGQHGSTDFRLPVFMPPLEAGEYTVALAGAGRPREFPLHVTPGDSWIHFHLSEAPRPCEPGPDGTIPDPPCSDSAASPSSDRPRLSLTIRHDGRAVAFREGGEAPARREIPPDSLRAIRRWFAEAGFTNLEDRYLAKPPSGAPRAVFILREAGQFKRVAAEDSLMPRPLLRLKERLQGLTLSFFEPVPPEPPTTPEVTGTLRIDPASATPGTPRLLRLTLRNEGSGPVVLTFPTSQRYDFAILARGFHPPDMPPDSIPGDVLVWNWAFGRGFAEVISRITLRPDQEMVFEETWDGRDNQDRVVDSGSYILTARVPAEPTVPVRPIRLRVGEPGPGAPALIAEVRADPVEGPVGSTRTLNLSVRNPTEEPVTLSFATSQRYDFAISDPRRMGPGGSGPMPVWIWSFRRRFILVPGTETWEPGEVRTFTEVWDGRTLEGDPAPPGDYILVGFLAGHAEEASEPTRLIINEP